MSDLFLGVDVGTGSARAGLFEGATGKQIGVGKADIITVSDDSNLKSQSTHDIWKAVCYAVRDCISDQSGSIDKGRICGIGFDATCSLVCMDKYGRGVDVNNNCRSNPTAIPVTDVILWMCHRASKEADYINEKCKNHEVLKHVGGKISPEMQIPKILWLKNKLKTENFNRIRHFMDLSDWLAWRATQDWNTMNLISGTDQNDSIISNPSRGICSLTCKWTFLNGKWHRDFFQSIGLLESLLGGTGASESENKIGDESDILQVGQPLKKQMSETVMKDMGIFDELSSTCNSNITVASGIIDAHCGTLGVLNLGGSMWLSNKSESESDQEQLQETQSYQSNQNRLNQYTNILNIISGTSCCHMILTNSQIFVPGIWGPYCGAVLPQLYLLEAGQSTAGAFLDLMMKGQQSIEIIDSVNSTVTATVESGDPKFYIILNDYYIERIEFGKSLSEYLLEKTRNLHFLPYLAGCRSGPGTQTDGGQDLKCTAIGPGELIFQSQNVQDRSILKIDQSSLNSNSKIDAVSSYQIHSCLIRYLSILSSIAYEAKEIFNALQQNQNHNDLQIKIQHINMCGGLSKNALFVQTYADVLGREIRVVDQMKNSDIISDQNFEPVLLGGAMVARSAYELKKVGSLQVSDPDPDDTTVIISNVLREMSVSSSSSVKVYKPRKETEGFHKKKFEVFKKMREDQIEYMRMMMVGPVT